MENKGVGEEFPESVIESKEHSLHLEATLLKDILGKSQSAPNSWWELVANFSTLERLRLYNFVLDKTGHLQEPELKISFDDGQKALSMADILRLQTKKKKAKYRVPKARPTSYTEELRGLIEIQMDAYCEYLVGAKEQERSKAKEKRHKSRDKSKKERSRRRSKSRERRHRSRSKKRS